MPRKRSAKGAIAVRQFILDCSIVLAWYFADEKDAYADSIAQSFISARGIVPSHWPLEVANGLVVGERRKRSTENQAIAFVTHLKALPIEIDDQTTLHAWSTIYQIARSHALSAYDAAYLELALRRNLPIATLDDPLKRAAQALGIARYQP